MNRSINLMSLHARKHECLRTRLRQWSLMLGAVSLLLATLALQRYMAYRSVSLRQFALEIKYDPIGELKTSNQVLAKQIAAIRAEEKFVLALSEREPTLSLLGLLGSAVSKGEQRVFLQRLELSNEMTEAPSSELKKAVLDMSGIANSGSAVNEFAEALQQTLPVEKVEVTSSKGYKVKQQPMQDFSVQLNF